MLPTTIRRAGAGAALLVAAAWLLPAPSDAGLKKDPGGLKKSYVKLTASAGKADAEGRQVVTVTMDIEKPWYAYANPVEHDDLEGSRTVVRIAGSKAKLE